MTVLLRRKGGQCDARCYDGSPLSRCRCVCGGRNHGKGRAVASAQSRVIRQEWSERAARGDWADELTGVRL